MRSHGHSKLNLMIKGMQKQTEISSLGPVPTDLLFERHREYFMMREIPPLITKSVPKKASIYLIHMSKQGPLKPVNSHISPLISKPSRTRGQKTYLTGLINIPGGHTYTRRSLPFAGKTTGQLAYNCLLSGRSQGGGRHSEWASGGWRRGLQENPQRSKVQRWGDASSLPDTVKWSCSREPRAGELQIGPEHSNIGRGQPHRKKAQDSVVPAVWDVHVGGLRKHFKKW